MSTLCLSIVSMHCVSVMSVFLCLYVVLVLFVSALSFVRCISVRYICIFVGCPYGDHYSWCNALTPFLCYIESNENNCCDKCREHDTRIPGLYYIM